MPQVGGKRFPYTRKGKAQAKQAILKKLRGIKKRGTYEERQARFARREEKGLPTGYRDPRKRAVVAKNKMRRRRGPNFGGYSSLSEAVRSGKFKSIRRKSPFNYKD